ncbi:type IV pilin protein [Clostridium culturomicium]|uniref:type IV pilin protein n=1 Tax=Clostridium culturomicium TaxID=1499683 RepID=UPI0038579336
MRKNKRLSKNGFSLIELIIVLAVMAIIALIAIPNFTAVRDSSRNKADKQSMEVIKRIMLVSQIEMDLGTNTCFDIRFDENDKLTLSGGGAGLTQEQNDYLEGQLEEVKRPQGMSTLYTLGKRADSYRVDIYHNGDIEINTYDSKSNGKPDEGNEYNGE